MRKGQAALEFLTTYGWAFLVILVMIGALAYFGVLNPQRYLPERCVVSSEIGCTDYMIENTGSASGTLSIYLTNNLGETVSTMTLTSQTDGVDNCVPIVANGNENVQGGASVQFTCDLTGIVPSAGEKLKLAFQVTYQKITGKYPRVVNGELFATVQ